MEYTPGEYQGSPPASWGILGYSGNYSRIPQRYTLWVTRGEYQVAKAKNEFSASMWDDKAKTGRRTLCKECCHPACTSRHCKTCRSCRNPACKKTTKRSHCTDEIQALHAKHLPRTLDEVQRFLCDNCKFITCMRIDSLGNRCGKEMPKKAQARLPQNPREEYICGTCQTLDAARASLGSSKR